MINKVNYVKIFIEWNGDEMKREIPLKNYIILFIIVVFTISFVFYLRTWYNTSKEYYQNNSIMSEYLSELKISEIGSYLVDNPNSIIYYASAKDTNIKPFEKKFKKLLEEYEIKNEIIYIDASKEENKEIISKLNNISDKKISEVKIPNLISVKDGKIDKILYSDDSSINKRDVQNFLIKCGIITND